MLDFKTKTRQCHVANVDNGKNPKFLAINHNSISFERDTYRGNKKIPTRLTIVRPLAAGWGAAPYKQNQKGVKTSRLSEYFTSPEHGPTVRLYSFEKASNNMEKGPRRDDITSELVTGSALNLWIDEKRLEEMKRTLPEGLSRIEAFTLCEIQVAPKNHEGAGKGSACKIVEIRPTSFTLYSCMQDIERFQPTMADARAALLKHQQHQPHIANDLVTNEPAFHIHVPHKAYLHEDPELPRDEGFITLVNTGVDPIDIPVHTLLAYTNSTDRGQACSLLEMAIATSSLQMFVVSSDYWKNATQSSLRGIPIINTEALLQCVVPALVGEQTCFPTPHTTQIDDVVFNIQIHVDQEPTAVATGLPPRTVDLVLTGKNVELERAYKIRFGLASAEVRQHRGLNPSCSKITYHHTQGREIPRYWVGYYDASPRQSVPAVGYKRRKITPCEADEEEADC